MKKLNILINGQAVCLRLDSTEEKLYIAIKEFIPGHLLQKIKRLDGIIYCRKSNNFKLIRSKIFHEEEYVLGKFYFRNYKSNNLINADYVIKPGERFTPKVILSIVNKFSKILSIYKKTLFLHASGVFINNHAYLFIGKSGSGKSTICKLLKNTTTIHDDSIVVRKKRNFLVYPGFRFRNEAYYNLKKPKKLKKILFIKKSNKNKVEKLPLKDSLSIAIANCRSMENCKSVFILDNLLYLLKHVPCYMLYFKKNPSFWKLIK